MTLITGTTGTIGRTVVDHLADANTDIAVRGMSRDPDDESSLAEVLDEFVAADYRYHETLRTALDGVEEAFLLTPDGPEQVAYKSDFIYEAERAGVAFVANLSVRGAALDPLTAIGRHHRLAELQLDAADPAGVHLRPTFLMQNLTRYLADSIRADGRIVLPFGDDEFSLVDARDVGAVTATTLLDPNRRNGPYLITGPEPLTFHEVADRLSSILDQPIAYDPVSPDRFKTSLLESGRPPWLANEFVELAAAAREGLTAPVTDAVHEATGENPRTFDAFVRDHVEELTPDSLS